MKRAFSLAGIADGGSFLIKAWLLAALLAPQLIRAQSSKNPAEAWLTHADLAPPFTAPASKMAWQRQRKHIRTQLVSLLGKTPPRPNRPQVQIVGREQHGDYVVERFQFDNGAGAVVPGCLLLPTNAPAKAPAILYCHWHGGDYDVGKEELFQTRHTPEAPGLELVRRGYIVLAIDAYCFGERNGHGPGGPDEKGGAGELTASKFNLWIGRSLWGMMLHDDLMALDYLASRPEIDPDRIGVMGMSMGATRSWWLMALDERIKTGVAICCLTRYRNLIEQQLLPAHGIYYYVPNILNHFDTEAIVALIAPRRMLFLDGDRDSTSPVDGIRAIETAVRPVYALYNAETNFQSIVYEGQGHVYTRQMWERTLAWLEQCLKSPAETPGKMR